MFVCWLHARRISTLFQALFVFGETIVRGKECPASFLNLQNRNGTHRLIPLKNRLRDSLTSFRFLQMILMDRIGMPDVPLDVYLFLNFRLLCIVFLFQSFERVKLLFLHLVAGRGRFSSLGLTTHQASDLKRLRRSWR